MELYLGIDLGGSHISGWLLDRNGKKYNPFNKIGINSGLSSEELINHLTGLINTSRAPMWNYNVLAIGLAGPGPLDPHEGVIISPPNLPNIKNLEVIKILREKIGLPAFLTNDADAAVIGEHWLGAAKDFRNVVMLTLGTGVGSGIIIGGRLRRGRGMGGEWGHTTIFSDESRKCSCGRINCLEAFVSTEGLVQTYCRVFQADRKSIMPEEAVDMSKHLRAGLKSGHDKWGQVLGFYCLHLADGIVNIANVHHPDCIVLGGGIAYEVIVKKVKTTIADIVADKNYKLRGLLDGLEIRMASVEQPGIVGAAKYAMNCHEAEIEKYRAEHGIFS